MGSRSWQVKVVWIALVLSVCCSLLVEAKRKKSSQGKKLEDYWPKVKWLLVAIFAPILIYFFYSIATDPALPGIMKRAGLVVRERFATHLGPTPKYKRR